MSDINKIIIAKTDKDNPVAGLPLWIHLADTAGVAGLLVDEWVPASVISATQMDTLTFRQYAVFCAAVHDIGKATSYFQSIITSSLPEQRDEMIRNGATINEFYLDRGKTPHAWAGQSILLDGLEDIHIHSSVANVIGAHHGRPIETSSVNTSASLLDVYPVNFYGSENDIKDRKLWTNIWTQIVCRAIKASEIESVSSLKEINIEAQILLSALLIIADWIASNTSYFPLISFDEFDKYDETEVEKRILDGWNKVRFPDRWNSEIYRMNETIFEERFHFVPNEIQKQVIQIVNRCHEPGIFILEAPMGTGKTEAALSAAEVLSSRKGSSGIYFGLPTQATSNALYGRLYEWASSVSSDTRNAIRLAHGAAELNDEYMNSLDYGKSYVDDLEQDKDLSIHPWFQGRKRALLADFVIGTIDQFLMASLKRKHFMLRHIGLAGKVVIIDECHAYDAYMSQYLERTLQWMGAYGIPVILLSATLPVQKKEMLVKSYIRAYSKYYIGRKKAEIKEIDRENMISYPSLTWTNGEEIHYSPVIFHQKEKQIIVNYLFSDKSISGVLNSRLNEGGCAVIIMNTVAGAQKIYELLSEELEDYDIILYHAQFILPDRIKKEKELMKRIGKESKRAARDKVILIGTQVLEQSLDYDADLMITQLCPMDLLLQRLGRLHRHTRDRPKPVATPICFILKSPDGDYDKGSEYIYGDYLLQKTSRLIPGVIRIPEDIAALVKMTYTVGEEDEYISSSVKEDYLKIINNKKEHARRFLLKEPAKRIGLEDMLKDQDDTNERYADNGVRDSEMSVEVLLMKMSEDGRVTFLNEENKRYRINTYDVPDQNTGRLITKQRIKLPHIFCIQPNINKTIEELETRNINVLSAWQKCSWIEGEIILLLDTENRTELNGYLIEYSFEKGLICKRKEDEESAKKRIFIT